jgi:hypothetical protein
MKVYTIFKEEYFLLHVSTGTVWPFDSPYFRKLTVSEMVKTIFIFYTDRGFISMLATARPKTGPEPL